MESPEIRVELVERIRRASHCVVLTGAGVSAESGIPTFRGTAGLWRSFRPEALATPEAFARDPVTVWAWYRWRQALIARVEPNAGHRAIAAAEARRAGWQVLTQNVDGLHARAGTRSTLELHGSIWRLTCSRGCGHEQQQGLGSIPREDAPLPHCTCGALLRPGVVWFGEPLDTTVVSAAWHAVERCDVLLVVGTSALVYPVAALPGLAARHGATVIEINPEPTVLSRQVDHSIRASAAAAVPALLDRV